MVHHEILPTPSNPRGVGVFTFYGSTSISAPASLVWSTLLDFPSYHKWNKYTPVIDHEPSSSSSSSSGTLAPGDTVVLHYRPKPTGETSLQPCLVLDVDAPNTTLTWRGCPKGIPTWLFLPEKIQRVTPKGDDECTVEIYETQGRPMAYLVKWTIGGTLSEMSQGMCDGLKEYVEALWAGDKGKLDAKQ